MADNRWEQRNFRLDRGVNTKLAAVLKDRHRDFADVARILLERWIIDESIETVNLPLYPSTPPRTLNKIITDKLIEQLQNVKWLPDSLVFDIQAFREGHSVFGTRIDHFRDEKQKLAEKMADWTVQRAVEYLRLNPAHQAYFCVDSGTGLYWFFRFLPDSIGKYASRDELSRLHIITNNVAGSECYGTRSQQIGKESPGKFGDHELSEVVKCMLLGGDLLPKYSAVTGKITEKTLKTLRSEAGDSARFFGLAVGHWIDLSQGSKTPVPLARGQGQVDFKGTLIDQCDEVFVLAPLGKLFAQTKDSTNVAIKATGAPYDRVRVDALHKVKLVTTCRSRGLLSSLSRQIQERYQQLTPNDNPKPTTPLEAIGAILFDFDHHEGITLKEEIQLDFPHRYEWNREFLASVFNVYLTNWNDLEEMVRSKAD